MKTDPQDRNRQYRRSMLRARFQSLFWAVLVDKKKRTGFKLTDLADALGVNKSYVSRSFSTPPNWQIDKISDLADSLNLDLEICAVDRNTGQIFTPEGPKTNFTVGMDGTTESIVRTSHTKVLSAQTEAFG